MNAGVGVAVSPTRRGRGGTSPPREELSRYSVHGLDSSADGKGEEGIYGSLERAGTPLHLRE